jgi:hypothetical protein
MAYSRESINSECERLGLFLLDDNDLFKRKQKVLVSCECGGTRGVSAFSLYLNQFCCKSASKEGVNNPAKGKDPWNKGRSDLSGVLSGRPEGSLNQFPFGEEIREKYRKARHRITINGQPWSGFKRPSDENKKDILYLVKLLSGHYKVGRSYQGANYRKKEIQEVLGEWKSISKYVWEIEQIILTEYKEYKEPLTEKSNGRGMTEWFTADLPTEEVRERITALLNRLTALCPAP